ncbi:MAG: type IV pilus assembly protein PilM [bacterium]|nr:type IV pilus assembly protein PilM [bacterium]
MLNPLRSLFGGVSYLGVDIGTTSIKIVEVSRRGGKPSITNYGVLESYGHLERPNNAIQTSTLKMLDGETVELLLLLLKQLKVRSKNVIASIPAFSAFVTLLEFPSMPDAEMSKAMQFQARQYIPLPISEVALDWIKVGERKDEQGAVRQQVLLISVPNDHIEKYKNIMSAAGLNLVALEIESLSLVRVLIAEDPTPTAIVDIGARSTNIAIVDKGNLKMNVQTDFAGGALTQAVASGLGISNRRAEELKKRQGLMGTGGEMELSTLMMPFVDAILNEVRRAKLTYERSYGVTIERIMLSGGGANLIGLPKYAEGQLGTPVVKGAPFSRVGYPPFLEPVIPYIGQAFSVALGLGSRQFL